MFCENVKVPNHTLRKKIPKNKSKITHHFLMEKTHEKTFRKEYLQNALERQAGFPFFAKKLRR